MEKYKLQQFVDNKLTDLDLDAKTLDGNGISAFVGNVKITENSTTGETAPIPDEQIDMIAMQMLSNGASLMQVIEFKKAASQVELPVIDEATESKQKELLQKNLELAQINSQISALYAEDVTTMATDSSVTDALKAMNKKVNKIKTARLRFNLCLAVYF